MTEPTTPAGPTSSGPGPAPYLIGSTDTDLLAELATRTAARRVSSELLVVELTDTQAADLRREYAGRAVIEPDTQLEQFRP